MTVFKGYLLLMKRNIKVLFLYLVLFLILTLLIQKFMGDDENLYDGTNVRLNVAVIDRADTVSSRAFTDWISELHQLVSLEDDQAVLQEEMFYGNVDYIIFLPEDFEERVLADGEALSVVEKPGSYQAVFVRQQINQFLGTVRTFLGSGYSEEDAFRLAAAQEELETEVTVVDRNGHGGATPGYITMCKYLSYFYIAVLCYCLGTVILIMRQKELRQRIQCSCVSSAMANAQALLACLCAGILLWLISLAMLFLLFGRDFILDAHFPGLLLNSFLMMLTGLSIAFLVGTAAPTAGVINSVVNVAAMGMCFLCGVFVPMSMLTGVRPLARLLPVYWNVTAINLLGDYAVLDQEMKQELAAAYGIQLLTAAILVAAGLALRKWREKQ